MDIHEALELIKEWVDQLEEYELPETCRESGRDFFSFLKRNGFNAGTFVNTVTPIIGHHPRNLWNRADAGTLRRAIEGYESTQAELCREEHRAGMSNNEWLQDATERYFTELE